MDLPKTYNDNARNKSLNRNGLPLGSAPAKRYRSPKEPTYVGIRKDVPVGDVPVGDVPVGDVPVEDVPVGDVPVGDAPVGDIPVGDVPVEDVPVGDVPVGDVPVEDLPVVLNADEFDCIICMEDVQPGDGIVIRDCSHSFCQGCLRDAIRYCEDPFIKCPHTSCDAMMQLREVQQLVPEDVFKKFLGKSLKVAESASGDSFYCCTPNCNAWCEHDDDVKQFNCPLCGAVNCITCNAIHHPMTYKEYQDMAELQSESKDGVEAAKSKDFLRGLLADGTAMRCPGCQLLIIGKSGCDCVRCTVCLMEICWATKGPRWGPKGKGDTTGGCRCGINGKRCHPNCDTCH